MFNQLSPLAQPVGLIWLALLLITAWLARQKIWRAAAATGTLALLMNLIGSDVVATPLLNSLERPYAHGGCSNVAPANAVVMLGGSHRPSTYDTFGLDLTAAGDRIVTALELMRLGKAQALVLGGNGYQREDGLKADSALLKNWFAAWQVPSAPVLDLGINANTHEEALKVAAMMKEKGWKKILLVTSAFHMRRAEATFRHLGIDVTPVACDFQTYNGPNASSLDLNTLIIPRIEGFQHLGLFIHETGGWLAYRWRGWVTPK